MFKPTTSWVESQLVGLVSSWGYFPTLESSEVLSHLGEHTYNLRAAQRIIEQHIWGDEVNADVKVKFVDISIPGRIKLTQTWILGKINLDMTIEVAERFRSNPGAQMTILAHEYAHAFHYLRSDFVAPSNLMEYEHLTDLSTIALGMGELTLKGRRVDDSSSGHIEIIGYLSGDLLNHGHEMYNTMGGNILLQGLCPTRQ